MLIMAPNGHLAIGCENTIVPGGRVGFVPGPPQHLHKLPRGTRVSQIRISHQQFSMTYNVQGFFSLNRIEQLCDAR
jgi:hypothetical protein